MSAPCIWKFPLRAWSIFLDMPRGAEVLSAGVQGGESIVAWAKCDPEAEKVPHMVVAVPTGPRIGHAFEGARFVNTVQMADGLIFHVFDGGERLP